MTQGVKERKSGTMSEAEKLAQATSEEKDKTPEKTTTVSPEEETPIYNQKQADALVHASTSDWGRRVKEIETERDNLKSQIKAKETDLEDIQAERETLNKQIDDLTSDDPKKFDLIKKDRELRTQERELKNRLHTLDDRETKLSEREKRVNSFEREVLIETIADEYEDGDAEKLKNAISGFENPTEEQIRTIADIFWKKKEEEEGKGKKPKAPKPYSGKSEGGSPYFTRAQIADRKFWEANRDEILKAQAEGRIRD